MRVLLHVFATRLRLGMRSAPPAFNKRLNALGAKILKGAFHLDCPGTRDSLGK